MVRWLALGLWFSAILFTSSLTSTPETSQPLRDLLLAKFGHVFVYSILGWLAADALAAESAGLALPRRLALLVAVLLGAALASLDEVRQTFVYSRTGQPADVLLDTVAASGGALLQYWLSGRYGGRPAGAAPADQAGEQQAAER